VTFIENLGQLRDEGVSLYGQLGSGHIAFGTGRVLIDLREPPSEGARDLLRGLPRAGPGRAGSVQNLLDATVEGCVVELAFEGSSNVAPRGVDLLPGRYNYFLGEDPEGWVTGARAYSSIEYEDLYPGIDLVYRGQGGAMKYEFVVAPGADPSEITVRVTGHLALRIAGGDLVIGTSSGELRDAGLDVFHLDSPGEGLGASFELRGPDRYGFVVEGRDPGRALVIDPVVFSTYLGTDGWEMAEDIIADSEGNAIVTGDTDTATFPTTPGAYQTQHANLYDVYVLKLSSDGSTPLWSTFIGGTDMDAGGALAIDDKGFVYVAGGTFSDNYPTTHGAFQDQVIGYMDAFVSKLSPDGSRLLASTIIGDSWWEYFSDLAVDAEGNMYIVGTTDSAGYPVTKGAADTQFYSWEAFVTKVNASATGLVYSTFIGGSNQDNGRAITVDEDGAAYVVGDTESPDLSTTAGAFQPKKMANNDTRDCFVTRIHPNGTSFEALSYLGGRFNEIPYHVQVGPEGDIHVVGETKSDDFPVTKGAFQTTIASTGEDGDAFAARMTPDLSTVVTCTFLGGSLSEDVYGAAVDPAGNVIIGGGTYSTDLPTTDGAFMEDMAGVYDGFVTKVSANYSSLEYSTFLGGIDGEEVDAVFPIGTLYILATGIVFHDDFPVTAGAFQTKHGGNRDGFVTKLTLDLVAPVAVAGPDVTVDQHETVHLNGSDSWDNYGVVNWTWSFAYGGGPVKLYGPLANWTFDDAGSYLVTLTVTDESRHQGVDSLTVNVTDITPPVADAGPSRTIRQGDVAQMDGSGSHDNVGIVNHTWTFDYFDQQVSLEGSVVDFKFDRAGEFDVTLTVRDAVGLEATDHVIVHVMDLTDPVANAGEDIHVDQHQLVELNGSLSSDTTEVVNWTWSFDLHGATVLLYGEVATYVFEEVGTYDVLLKVFDGAGNTDLDTVRVFVRDSTPPLADAGPDKQVDQGATVTFDGSGSTDNVAVTSFNWTFEHSGQAISLDGKRPSFIFEVAGTYTVTLSVSDAEGNVGTDTTTVVVDDVTAPVASAGDDVNVDQGHEVTFDGSASHDNVGITAYAWLFTYDGELQELEGVSPAFTFGEAGSFSVTLKVWDAAGLSATDTLVVRVRDTAPPLPDAGEDRTVDQGVPVGLDGTASSDNVGIVSYTWSFDDGGVTVTLSGATAEHTFDTPGVYVITLAASDDEGNTATDSFELRVRDVMEPTVSARVPSEASVGRSVTFDATGCSDNVGVVKWTWTFKEGGKTVTLDGEKVTHTFDEAGDYEVTLTVEDAEGNQATEVFEVSVSSSLWLYILVAIVVAALAGAVLYKRTRRDRDLDGA